MRTKGTQPAASPTRFSAATGSGPLSINYAENYENKQFHKSVCHR